MKAQITPIKKLSYLVLWFVLFSFFGHGQKKSINAGWQFKLDKDASVWETINIPHTWNLKDAFDDEAGYYRGIGHYKKQVFFAESDAAKVHYLRFKGVNQDAKITVNGNLVGTHQGGYTAFTFNISAFLNFGAYNLIEVIVDNSHNEDIPPLDADFTFFGGIYRDVELLSKPKQHLALTDFSSEGFYVNYPSVSEEKAQLEVTARIDNFEDAQSTSQLRLEVLDANDSLVLSENENFKFTAIGALEKSIKFSDLKNPRLWSPERPYLYQLKIVLLDDQGVVLDRKTQQIGFRWVSVDASKGFYLNGKPYKLIGVNRHQDYDAYANAVPMALQKQDIQLIKDMGANVLRFAHYPQAQELYKLCDQLGILVWTEIPIVNKITNTKAFFDTALKMQEEQIKQYYNYPSVVMIGYMNEIFLRMDFDKKTPQAEKDQMKTHTYDLAEQLEKLTREKAPHHITVMALHYNELYNETKIADLPMLVGWNLYFGWYYETIADLGVFLDEQHQRFPNRPIMISEYGPGADVRVSAAQPERYDYSQQYQLKLHSSYVEQVQARDFVAGMTAWNFADFASEFRGETIPHINQKGLVTNNRVPKEIYYWYQAVLLKNTPVVHIANYQTDLTLFDNAPYEMTLFSNQASAKLSVNNAFFKEVTFNAGIARVLVPFTDGLNTLSLETASVIDEATFQVRRIESLKNEELKSFAINIGASIDFKDLETGVTYLADRPYKDGLYGYDSQSGKCERKLLANNIKNSNLEAVYQHVLVDCSRYKVAIPDGSYKVTLYFVEPQQTNQEHVIFNLNRQAEASEEKEQRIFDVLLNGTVMVSSLNLAKEYPNKYGVQHSFEIDILNNEGLTLTLKPLEGAPVISGILIETLE
ncbi:glycoside hydrolase family 2 [Subsaximicrobium wynnwilliamsii]|uniref:Glycoside hydrolase family 2 n=1 Tax=Subsaximicrobium wynnwilliamsii TaxID=291179 RepID=A0A5C6ZEU4_9FLAO|nr:glycoside hydrolase family 2 TIM barrel-domain containing protein [Subsaximicrobium wynnwilliamsii]TXD81975.1 glycoside hydrolase family 2 [Subsaximicrobium wynnwilliamsii]TXD87673.1 glycoside hydrolase family 2 [Subsaximicrobium wynnwilliamsii]TXE01419.1 glycoside hydrolase family 2 [Subsaximicrobium wynnwilliamsii]